MNKGFKAQKPRMFLTVASISLFFGVLLGGVIILQGLEDLNLKYAGEPTNGKILVGKNGRTTKVFDSPADALSYLSKINKNREPLDFESELITTQVATYNYFENLKKNITPVVITIVFISIIVLVFTVAHSIDYNRNNIALYYSLGASKSQVLTFYLFHLLRISLTTIIFTFALAFSIAGATSLLFGNGITAALQEKHQTTTTFYPIFIGFNFWCAIIPCAIFLTSPIALLLCLDQFSRNRITEKLKKD